MGFMTCSGKQNRVCVWMVSGDGICVRRVVFPHEFIEGAT